MSKVRVEECDKRVLNAKFSMAERDALAEIDYSLAEGTKQAVKFFVEYKRAEIDGSKDDRVIEKLNLMSKQLDRVVKQTQTSMIAR